MSRRSGAFPPLSGSTERERGVKFSHRLMDTAVENPYETFSGDQFEDWVDGLKSKIRAALNPPTTAKGKQRDPREGAGVRALLASVNGAHPQEEAREEAVHSPDQDASLSHQGDYAKFDEKHTTQEHGHNTKTYDATGQHLYGDEEYDDEYDYDKEEALSEPLSRVERDQEDGLSDFKSPDVLEITDSEGEQPASIDDAAGNGSSPPWDESGSVAGYSDEGAGAPSGYVNGEEGLDGDMGLEDAGHDEDADMAGEDYEGNEEDELLLHSDDGPYGATSGLPQASDSPQFLPGPSPPASGLEKEVFVIDDSDDEALASAHAPTQPQSQLELPLPAAHFDNNDQIDPALDGTYEPSSGFDLDADVSQQQQPWYPYQDSTYPGLPAPLFDPSVGANFNYLTDSTAGYQLGVPVQDPGSLLMPGQTERSIDVGNHYGPLGDPNMGVTGSPARFSDTGGAAFEVSEMERVATEDAAFTTAQLGGDFASLLEAAAMHDPSLRTIPLEPGHQTAHTEVVTPTPLTPFEPETIDLDADDSHEYTHTGEIQVSVQAPDGDPVSETVAQTPASPLFMQSDELPDHGLHVADDSALLPGERDSDEPDKHLREHFPNVEALHAPSSPLLRRSRSISPGRVRSPSPQPPPPHIFLEKEEVPERVAAEITEAERSATPDPEKHSAEDVAEGEFDELEASGDEADSVHSALSPQQPQVVISSEQAAGMTEDEKHELLHRPDIDPFSLMGNESTIAPGAVESEEGESSGDAGESLDELFEDQEDNRDEWAEEAAVDPVYSTGAHVRAGSDSMEVDASGKEDEEMDWSAMSQPVGHAEVATSVAASDESGESTQELSQNSLSEPETHGTDSMIESTQLESQAVVPSSGFATRPSLMAVDSLDEVNLGLYEPMDTGKDTESDQDIDFSAMPSQMAGFLDTPEAIGSPASGTEAVQEHETTSELRTQKTPTDLPKPSSIRLTRSRSQADLAAAGASKARDASPSQSTNSRESSVEPAVASPRGRRRKPEPQPASPESSESTPQPSPKTRRGRANGSGKEKGKSAKREASLEPESPASPSNGATAEDPTPAPAEQEAPTLRTQTARHYHGKAGKSAGPTWASIKWGSILPALRFMGGGKTPSDETEQQFQESQSQKAQIPQVQSSRSEPLDESSQNGAEGTVAQSRPAVDALDGTTSVTAPLAESDSAATSQLDATETEVVEVSTSSTEIPAELLQIEQPAETRETAAASSAADSPTAPPEVDTLATVTGTGSEVASSAFDRPGPLSIHLPSPLEASLATPLLTPTAQSPTRSVLKPRPGLHSHRQSGASHDAPQETGRLMRSNCQFHKISVPGSDGELEYFIAPACSIADRSKRNEVEAHDHGIATDEDHLRTIQELDYADDAAVHALRQLVGLDLLREGRDVGYIIREGETYDSLRARQPNNYFAAYRREGGPRSSLHKKRSRPPSVASVSTPVSEVGDGVESALMSPTSNARPRTSLPSSPISPPEVTRRKRRKVEADYQPGAEDEQIEEQDQVDDHDTLIPKPTRSSRRKKAPDNASSQQPTATSDTGADLEQAVAKPSSNRSGGKNQSGAKRNKGSLLTTMGPPSPPDDSSQISPRKRGKKRAAEDDDQNQEMEKGGTTKKAKLSSDVTDS